MLETQVTNLEEQLEQFREELENKNEEVQQLHMQLEIQRKESTTHLQELEQENKLFKVTVQQRNLKILSPSSTEISSLKMPGHQTLSQAFHHSTSNLIFLKY